MASKRAQRRRACGDKVRHETVEAARVAQARLFFRDGEKTRVYRCGFCRRFHIGHFGPVKVLA